MENEEIFKRIEEQGKKLEEIHQSVERMRKFFLWTLIITAAVIILPLIGLLLIIPQFLDIYTSGMNLSL